MFIPNIGPLSSLLVGAALTVTAPTVTAADNYMIGRCIVSQPGMGAQVRPANDGNGYLYTYLDADTRYQGFDFNSDDVKVTLVKAPAHGKVVREESSVSMRRYHYTPSESYVGQDRFVMQVEKNGVKVRIQYLIEIPLEDEPSGHMCNPEHWKISSTTPALDNARLQVLLGAANVPERVPGSGLSFCHSYQFLI